MYLLHKIVDNRIRQLFNQVLTFLICFVYWITQEVRTYVEGIFDTSSLLIYGATRNIIALFKREERHRRSLAPMDFIGVVHCKFFPHKKYGKSPCRKVFPVISM